MTSTAMVLAILAGLLLWPAPLLLSTARWTRREPRAALILWQSLGLAAGSALLGAVLAVALAPVEGGLFEALSVVVKGGGRPLTDTRMPALAIALGLLSWLVFVLIHRFAVTLWARRQHRRMLDLVADP
ncbi:MAG: M56 family peptidase, partial [Longispora sp.]|nr:M56 family peptidase [Longispora sp. (in: high G+C Gram-positive bacteria)]